MIDLIETEEIKEKIKANPENLAQILEEASMGVCITNTEANFVLVNENYAKIYGYSKDELIGKPFTLVVPEEAKEKMNLLHEKFLRDKVEVSRNWEVQNKSGNILEISVDTAYSEAILDKTPYKITFVHVSE